MKKILLSLFAVMLLNVTITTPTVVAIVEDEVVFVAAIVEDEVVF